MIKCTFRVISVLAAAFVLQPPVVVDAQETRTVQGVVRDSTTGETVPFAIIAIPGTTLRTASNRDGYFALVGAPPGPFMLRVSSVGFRVAEVLVEVELGAQQVIVEMSRVSFQLEDITVVADDYRIMRVTDGVSRITASPRDMAVLPNVGEVDIFRSLQLLPGISGTNESSSGLYVRGGTPDQNLVLLDGMTVYHVDHFFGFFSAFNADAIKDVQVYKGGFPAQYGGRVSSVVDMTGKTGDPNRAHLTLGANLLSAQTSVQIPLFGKGSVILAARRSYTDVLQTGLYNSIFNPSQGTQPTRAINSDITDLTDWGNKGVSGKWARQWGARLYSNLLVAYSEYFSDYRRQTDIEIRNADADSLLQARSSGSREDNQVRDLTVRLDNEWQILRSHKIDFGTWITQSDVRFTFMRNDTTTVLDRNQEGLRVAGYAQDTWSIGSAFNITFGGRVAYYDNTAKTYLEPRASASWNLTDRFKVKGAYGRYHQFVNRVVNENVTEGSRDFWLLADGDLVDVTSSEHYVAGASYETDEYLVDVELYRKDMDGLSEFSLRFQRARRSGPQDLFFQGTGVAKGIELLLQKKAGMLTGWASYTLARVEHTFPELNNGETFPALHDQRHEFKAISSLSLGRWNFSGTWVFGSGKPYTAPQSEYAIELLDGRQQSYIHVSDKNSLRLPPYHRLDLATHYRFSLGTWSGDVGFSVFNAYNRTNIWYREFELTETPVLVTDVTYLGVTPNLSVRFEF